MKGNFGLLALSLSLLLWSACSSVEPRAATQDGKSAVESAQQEKQVYQAKVDAKLYDLDRRIDALQEKVDKQAKAGRKQLERQMSELRRKRQVTHRELDEFENSSLEAWQQMKVGLNSAVQDLESAYEKAASHFSDQESKYIGG